MKRFLSLTMCVLLVASFAAVAAAKTTAVGTTGGDLSGYNYAIDGPGVMLHSAGNPAALSKVGADSFVLFGGPDGDQCDLDETEGKFQDVNAAIPNRQGWIGIDLTDLPTLWQRSTYYMENLNNNGAGNYGMWCGFDCTQATGWTHCPGYGNGWFAILAFQADYLGDTANGQTVGIDFFFNHDSEPGYDYLEVWYDSAATWTRIWQIDSANDPDTAPGIQYSTLGTQIHDIIYVGNDYGGDTGDKIALRIIGNSDGAWSDEDGLWPTNAGLAQVDDITVTYNDGATKTAQNVFENFQGDPPYAWMPEKAEFVGEFSKTFFELSDNDPCTDNPTPLMTFIDDGTPPSNPDNNPPVSTGGETSGTWSYGVQGGWVVNYNGGLTFGNLALRNEVWSPPFVWDLPCTTADDDIFYAGSVVRFTVWRHLPLANGMFYLWHVRYSTDNQATWSAMVDRNFVYYGSVAYGDWLQVVQDTADIIGYNEDTGDPVTHVQIGLAAWDYADVFTFPGNDSTPSPAFDDVTFVKYLVGGAVYSTRTIDTLQDSFPNSGSIDVSDQTARDGLDCRIDMARDIGGNTTVANLHGDSLIVDVNAIVVGTQLNLQNMKMIWRLDVNPLFEAAIRGNLTGFAGAQDEGAGTAGNGVWHAWTGDVEAQESTTSVGVVVADRYFWDLPDENFAYPGDILYYYIEVTDSGPNGGNTTTFPAITDGFGTPDYNRAFTVRFLPTIFDAAGTQPNILLWNDFGRRGGENDYLQAFEQNGYTEGVSWDTYTTQGPSSNVANGLGASGSCGASSDQLAGYDTIIYVGGDLGGCILSDGSDSGLNDKGNDLETLTGWHDLAGDRFAAFFADNMASDPTANSSAGAIFVSTVLNVGLNDNAVGDEIGDQTAPHVIPAHPSFSQDFIAYGGCFGINSFDSIIAGTGAVVGHRFTDKATGVVPYTNVAASVIYDRNVGVSPDIYRKVDITFPYGFVYVYNTQNKGVVSARTNLLREVLDYFGTAPTPGPAVGQDPIARRGVYDLSNYPNPFNPNTTVKFVLGAKSLTTVKVYNLRGELVATVANEIMDAGSRTVTWNGLDSNGASVASGVYVIQVEGDGASMAKKVALVK
jgi:hypothetical protein